MRNILVWMVTPALFLATACTTKLFSTKISVECTVEAPSATDKNEKVDSGHEEEVPPFPQEHFPDGKPKKKKTATTHNGSNGSIDSPFIARAIVVDRGQENSNMASETPVRAIRQDTDVWCWAASAQTIMASHGRDTPQCEMVNAVYAGGQEATDGRPFCCNDPYHTACQQNGWPHQVFNKFDFEWNYVMGPLWQENVKKQIDSDGPFIFVLLYAGGGGHSFVVKDYQVIDGELFVAAYDHSSTQDKKAKNFWLWSYEEFAHGVYLGKAHEHFVDYVLMNPNRDN
jgi:hypothetical protein